MKIWFTKGLSNTIHALRHLRRAYGAGISLHASHTDPQSRLALLAGSLLDGFHHEPREIDASYVDWLLDVTRREGIDLIIAQRGLDVLWPRRHEFAAAGIRLDLPCSPENHEVIEAKDRFGARVLSLGLPFTPFMTFSDLAGFDQCFAEMRAEGYGGLCVKPVQGIYAAGFRVLRGEDAGTDLDRMLRNEPFEISTSLFRQFIGETPLSAPMMLMPFLPGIERSIDFLARDGKFICGMARIKRGAWQEIEISGQGQDMAAMIASEFGLNGICNLQTREDGYGRQHILEVNARMSGGMQMSCMAGIDLPVWNVALALGLSSPEDVPAARPGCRVLVEDEAILLDELPPTSGLHVAANIEDIAVA